MKGKYMKKLLLVPALLLIPRLMFSKTTTYNTSFNSPKKFTINYSIDRDTFDQYVDINSEGVFLIRVALILIMKIKFKTVVFQKINILI